MTVWVGRWEVRSSHKYYRNIIKDDLKWADTHLYNVVQVHGSNSCSVFSWVLSTNWVVKAHHSATINKMLENRVKRVKVERMHTQWPQKRHGDKKWPIFQKAFAECSNLFHDTYIYTPVRYKHQQDKNTHLFLMPLSLKGYWWHEPSRYSPIACSIYRVRSEKRHV